MATKKHLVKCKYCGEQFDINTIPFIYLEKSRRYVHKECPDGNSETIQREKDRDTLANYIKTHLGQEIYGDPKTWVQLERYYKKDFTPIGIYNCLVYMLEIQHKSLKNGNLGLIPYYYKDAQEYFEKIEKAKEVNEERIAESDNFYQVIEVTIKSPQRKKQKPKLFSFLDEEDLNG